MRIQWESPPASPAPVAETQIGRPIRQPGKWPSAILSSLAGLVLLTIPAVGLMVYSFLHERLNEFLTAPDNVGMWIALFLAFFLCIPVHELLHAALYPDFARSDSTVLFVAWRKLQFGVYYEGCISRTRWLAMRLFPILGLTILPLIVWMAVIDGLTTASQTFLIVLVITNSMGSGGDLVAALLVFLQVPASGLLNFYRGKAYWKPAENQAARPPAAIKTGESSANGDRS
jgi:hypothetical protein